MIVRDFHHPFPIVQDKGFRYFVGFFDPSFVKSMRQELAAGLLKAANKIRLL